LIGNAAPFIENAAPVNFTELTVSAVVPDPVKVSDLVEAAFKSTLPKAMVLALTVSWDESPVPLRLTVLVPPPDELLEILIVPLAVPAAEGWKLT
jgi:hypothetical protein